MASPEMRDRLIVDFQEVAVRVFEVEFAPDPAGVDLPVGVAERIAFNLAFTRPKIASNSAALTWNAS